MVKARSKLRERIREATAEAILDAAETVFAAEGVRTARVERIAQVAGVSVGTLYNHFDDREAVLCALIRARKAGVNEALDAQLAQADRPFREQLSGVLQALFDNYESHRPFFSVLLQGEVDRGAARARAKTSSTRGAMLEIRKRLQVLVDRGIEAGEVDPGLAKLAPTLLLGAARAVIVRAFFEGDLDARASTGELVRFFLHGAGRRHG